MVFQDALRKKCPYSEYFWSIFSRIFQYLSVLSPNAGKCEQKKLQGHFSIWGHFSRSDGSAY